MAKEIKAIQCPKCGSTQKLEIKPDYFKCKHCDTEYFLDNDDITINHNINYQNPRHPAPVRSAKVTGVVIALFFTIAFVVFFFLFKTSNKTEAIPDYNNAYRWHNRDAIAYQNTAGKLIIAIMGERVYDNDEQDKNSGVYISFYDALTNKELKSQRLSQFSDDGVDKIEFNTFANSDVYAIANESRLFKIDKINTTLKEVPPVFFTHHKELEAGIAHIEFNYRYYGDGFKLITNDGKNRTFYPIVDSVYTNETFYKAQDALKVKNEDVKANTYFTFSEYSRDFPDEKIQLMMYTQKDNKGGPKDLPYFKKQKTTDYQGRAHINDIRQGSDIVISYKDLTPGRLYFDPKILYGDESYVLISFKTTAAEKANTSVQCISVPDGHIVFTLPLNSEKYFDDEAVHFKSGFVLQTYESMFVVGMDGKLINKFKL